MDKYDLKNYKVNSMDFNYVDAYNSSKQLEFLTKQHDIAVELQGRRTYIFKLDKTNTEKSDIYNEAIYGRLYLPHFEQRALYNTNEWSNSIGLNNYIENEENLSLEYNFVRMVCNIRDLKDKISGKITIRNISKNYLKVSLDDFFTIKSELDVVLIKEEIDKYKSIPEFIHDIESKCSLIKIIYEGDMEAPKNINKFSAILSPNPNKTFISEVKDKTYENCTDVIEAGDIILTDKYKLYQVQSVYPSGNAINEYTSWTAKCNILDLAAANLPDDYRKIVERNRYGLPKVDKE